MQAAISAVHKVAGAHAFNHVVRSKADAHLGASKAIVAFEEFGQRSKGADNNADGVDAVGYGRREHLDVNRLALVERDRVELSKAILHIIRRQSSLRKLDVVVR